MFIQSPSLSCSSCVSYGNCLTSQSLGFLILRIDIRIKLMVVKSTFTCSQLFPKVDNFFHFLSFFFIFGCVGSFLLPIGFSLAVVTGGRSVAACRLPLAVASFIVEHRF